MKLTTTERDIIGVIMNCMFFNTGITSIEEHRQEYPGVTLTNIDDGHVCHLTISTDSQFFNRLSDELEYKAVLDCYEEIEEIGYSDCISIPLERPVGLSIFLSQYCDNLCWLNKVVIGVRVSGIYIDFDRIEKLLLKMKQCSTYGVVVDTKKLIDKIYANIRNGVYDINITEDDEYI